MKNKSYQDLILFSTNYYRAKGYDDAFAEDMAQDAILRLLEQSQKREIENLKAYIRTIFRCVEREALRIENKAKVRKWEKKKKNDVFTEVILSVIEGSLSKPTEVVIEENPYTLLEQKEIIEKVCSLPGQEGEVASLIFSGETVTEIAKSKGITKGRVSQIKRQAIQLVAGFMVLVFIVIVSSPNPREINTCKYMPNICMKTHEIIRSVKKFLRRTWEKLRNRRNFMNQIKVEISIVNRKIKYASKRIETLEYRLEKAKFDMIHNRCERIEKELSELRIELSNLKRKESILWSQILPFFKTI